MAVVLSVNVMSSLVCFVMLGPASLRSRPLEEVGERPPAPETTKLYTIEVQVLESLPSGLRCCSESILTKVSDIIVYIMKIM